MKSRRQKIAGLILALFFVQAVLLSSVCVSTKHFSGSKERALLSLDVCGHGGPSGILGGVDFVAAVAHVYSFNSIENAGFPPTPGETVASAEPGETGKPPKPSLS